MKNDVIKPFPLEKILNCSVQDYLETYGHFSATPYELKGVHVNSDNPAAALVQFQVEVGKRYPRAEAIVCFEISHHEDTSHYYRSTGVAVIKKSYGAK